MRELKFRTWDKDKKEWIKSNCHYCGSINYNNDPNYIVMQYTGLKDSNEKEIYEGDIIHCLGGERYNGIWECNLKGIVTFSKSASFDVVDKDNCYWSFGNCLWEIIYILGNIYENPELVK